MDKLDTFIDNYKDGYYMHNNINYLRLSYNNKTLFITKMDNWYVMREDFNDEVNIYKFINRKEVMDYIQFLYEETICRKLKTES